MGFTYRNERLFAEELDCEAIAQEYGTPCYVYSRSAMEAALAQYHEASEGL